VIEIVAVLEVEKAADVAAGLDGDQVAVAQLVLELAVHGQDGLVVGVDLDLNHGSFGQDDGPVDDRVYARGAEVDLTPVVSGPGATGITNGPGVNLPCISGSSVITTGRISVPPVDTMID